MFFFKKKLILSELDCIFARGVARNLKRGKNKNFLYGKIKEGKKFLQFFHKNPSEMKKFLLT